jgi:hypothetical protein
LPASDRAAVALALRLPGRLVRAYCRPGDEEARRYALAAAAVSTGSAVSVASVHAIESAEFDVLLAGEGGTGEGGDLLLARLAERHGCALVFEVLEVEEDGEGLRVTRDLGRGAREVLSVEGPAVLGVSAQAPRGKYVSHYRRQAAAAAGGWTGGDDAGAWSGAAEGGASPWGPARPRPRTGDLAARTAPPAEERMLALFGVSGAGEGAGGKRSVIEADPETCARHLLRFLAHHGFIERRGPRRREAAAPPGRDAEAGLRQDRARGAGPPASAPAGRLSRGPRPVGQERPARVRGPYGVDRHA